jgi:acetyl esterase/lipase
MMPMGIIYLGLGLLLFGTTLGVLFPRIYGRLLSPAASIPAMVLALFLPHFVLAGLLLTAVVGALGGLAGAAGRIGLALHLISWGLLLLHVSLWRRVYPVLDGTPVTDTDLPFCEGPGGAPCRISLSPFLLHRTPAMREVEVVRDVVFRDVDGIRLRLDVYRPRRETPGAPLGPPVVYIHGGGWMLGNRRQSRFMMYELAAAGWVVFAISYRFAPRFPLPAAIVDCKAAIAWVREHGAAYGALPGPPVVVGGSAGGHLASMMALTPDERRFQPGFAAADTRVAGAVVFYGVAEFVRAFEDRPNRLAQLFFERLLFKARFADEPDRFRLAQPMSHVSADVPPILLVHGLNDGLVPVGESRRLYRRLRHAGARRVHLLEVPLALHAFEVTPSPLHQRTMRIILQFMETLRSS